MSDPIFDATDATNVTGAVPVLIISGSVGVGKTTIALAIHDLLSAWSMPHACVDRDALTWSWPPEGPFNEEMARRNLIALWRNYRTAGARHLVVAGVLERSEDRRAYAEAIPGAILTVCRLVAPRRVREARLSAREQGASLEWHLARTAELDLILDAAKVEDFIVENDERMPEEVALEVLHAAGWRREG